MKRLAILGALVFGSGCATGYQVQEIVVGSHKVRLYENIVEVQNSYARYSIREKNRLNRDVVRGFFNPIDNSLHCPIEYFDYCIFARV